MLGAEGLPPGLQVAAWLFAVILFIGACAGGYYLVRGRKATANQSLADSAVQSLTGELAASNSRIDRLETDNHHLTELYSQQKELNESLSTQINDLREWVTARDLMEALDLKVENGFKEVLRRLPAAS